MSHPTLTTFHQTPYETISPSRPELAQTGKTIVITGGNTGIGLAISRAFVHASAKRVIILGRRSDVVQAAAKDLGEEAKQIKSPTQVDGIVCDIASLESTNSLWSQFEKDGTVIDVLVLSAAAHGATAPLLKSGLSSVWGDFEANVRSSLDFTERFYKQSGKGADSRKFLVNISTNAAYMWSVMAPERPSYGMTKSASTLLLQQIAKDTGVDDMQIVSFHPGGVLTDMARASGVDENMGIPFDDVNLPGHFAVWAASREAEHLHGRFVWANWDVNEVKNKLGDQLRGPGHFLQIGMEGLSESGPNPMFEKMAEMQKAAQQ